jgi:hypothetical protein
MAAMQGIEASPKESRIHKKATVSARLRSMEFNCESIHYFLVPGLLPAQQL